MIYCEQGRLHEAKEMEEAIERCRERQKERQLRGINVLEPTKELIEEAKKFRLDLNDPKQRLELDRLMWETSLAMDKPSRPRLGSIVACKHLCQALCSRRSKLLQHCIAFTIVILAVAR